MDCSQPGSSVHGIFQAIVLKWIATSFSRGSSQPRDWTLVSHIVDRCFTVWATREVLTHCITSPKSNCSKKQLLWLPSLQVYVKKKKKKLAIIFYTLLSQTFFPGIPATVTKFPDSILPSSQSFLSCLQLDIFPVTSLFHLKCCTDSQTSLHKSLILQHGVCRPSEPWTAHIHSVTDFFSACILH